MQGDVCLLFYAYFTISTFAAARGGMKRKSSNQKPFPGGRVARLCRDGMRDTLYRFAFSLPPARQQSKEKNIISALPSHLPRQEEASFVLIYRRQIWRRVRWRYKLHLFRDDLIRLAANVMFFS